MAVLVGALLASAGTAGWCADVAAAVPTPPNVVVFFVDDLGWADPAVYGSRYHLTPNIDRLAAAGVRFTDAYAASPVCSPTRASVLTGKYPARLNLTEWLPGPVPDTSRSLLPPRTASELPLAEVTLAERFAAAGYATAHIGKWHLGGAGFGPREQGFAVNVGGDHHGTTPSYFFPYRDAAGPLPALDRGTPGEYLTDRLTDEAVRFIGTPRQQPFFLYFAHYAVHIPLRAPGDAIARFRARSPAGGRQRNAVYAAMLESVDRSLGRVLDALDQQGLAANTIVVFTSDNGGLATPQGPDTPATSNLPLRAGKGYLYEGGLRVPLIIAGPGVFSRGAVDRTPVISNDLYPTVLEMTGIAVGDALIDGVSLAGLLRDGPAPTREALYWHYPHYSGQGGRPGGAIRVGRYKLIEFFDGGVELYDLVADVGEGRSLTAAQPDVVRDLKARLSAWRARVGAQSMTPQRHWWSILSPTRGVAANGQTSGRD